MKRMFWVVGGSPVIRGIIRHREVSIKLSLTAVRSTISPKLATWDTSIACTTVFLCDIIRVSDWSFIFQILN